MKLKRQRLNVLFSGAIILICLSASVAVFAQDEETQIVEGKSFGKVEIGKTTMDEVAAIYGQNYALMNHREYSFEMIYASLGLSFYACQSDPNKEVFAVKVGVPFRARTNKGIVLGESTLGDVFRIYGTKVAGVFSDSDQPGINFFVDDNNDPDSAYKPASYEEDSTEMLLHKQKIIKRFNLVEKNGLRQCDEKFSQK